METIEFRAWDIDNEKMMDWFTLSQSVWNTDDSTLLYKILVSNRPKFKIMLFTGLEDKNGNKIYAGDIVKKKNGEIRIIGFVKYCWKLLSYYEYKNNDAHGSADRLGYYTADLSKLERIGNIYDNSDMATLAV